MGRPLPEPADKRICAKWPMSGLHKSEWTDTASGLGLHASIVKQLAMRSTKK